MKLLGRRPYNWNNRTNTKPGHIRLIGPEGSRDLHVCLAAGDVGQEGATHGFGEAARETMAHQNPGPSLLPLRRSGLGNNGALFQNIGAHQLG